MQSEEVIELLENVDKIANTIESVIAVNFLLAGILTGVLLLFIFFFFLKGAE